MAADSRSLTCSTGMNYCGRCRESVGDGAQCSMCAKHFHYPCSGVTETGFRKLGDRRANWKCPSCKADGGGSKQGSPKPVSLDTIMQELANIQLTLVPLSSVMNDIKEIKDELACMKASFGEYSAGFLQLERRVQQVEKSQEDVAALGTRLDQLESDLNERNQWLRMNNVEIKGVPMKDHENLFDLVSKIGNKISYAITKPNINFVARVPSRDNNTKPIIVSFINRYTKEDFVAAARAYKTLSLTDVGFSGVGRIYVNDHLTTQNKLLLTKTKGIAKKNHFEYVWVKNSKIFVRRDSQSKIIHIRTEKDLSKIST